MLLKILLKKTCNLLQRNVVWILVDNCVKWFPGNGQSSPLWWVIDWYASNSFAEFFFLWRNKLNFYCMRKNKTLPSLQLFLQSISLPLPAIFRWDPSWRFRHCVYLPHSIYSPAHYTSHSFKFYAILSHVFPMTFRLKTSMGYFHLFNLLLSSWIFESLY